MNTPLKIRVFQTAYFGSILALWYGVTEMGYVSAIFLPKLPIVVKKFFNLVISGEWISPLSTTLFEVACAFTIATISGVLIGFFVSRKRFSIRVFEPLFSSLFAIPLIIFYPLAMLFFGLGVGSKIALGSLVAFFPIVLNTISGFGNVSPIYKKAASSMGASGYLLVCRVLLPAAFPIILTGLRIGFIVCFLSIVGGETLGSLDGLGHKIVFNAESMNTSGMFAWIVFIVLIAFGLNTAIQRLEKIGEHH